MIRKTASAIMLLLLIMSMLALVLRIQPVRADGTIYIRADGSVDPPTAPISSSDNISYYLMADIGDAIFIEKDNIVFDGSSHVVDRQGAGVGIYLGNRYNVTIRNTEFRRCGLELYLSSNNRICDNNVTNGGDAFSLYTSANSNSIFNNNIISCGRAFYLSYNSGNIICGNNVTANNEGLYLVVSSNNTISENSITRNNIEGVFLYSACDNNTLLRNNIEGNGQGVVIRDSVDNKVYNNNFVNNTQQVDNVFGLYQSWDDGYPSGGNYWSDYTGADIYNGPYQNETGSDGIGDTPYVIDVNNIDHYPHMNPCSQVVQYMLIVSSTHDSPSPPNGGSFYNDYDSVTCSVSSPVIEGSTVWTCTGWTGTGSVPSSGSGPAVTFTITQDSGITWNWAPTSYNVTIVAHCNTEGVDLNVNVSIDSSATYNTPHTFTGLSGIHTFTVSQYDEKGHPFKQWSTEAVTDTISLGAGGTLTAFYEADKKPIAVLTVQEDVVNIGTNVAFFGDASYTPDGSKIKSFFFDFGDGNNSGWVNYPTVGATHAYSIPGQYSAKLIVINNEGVESDWSAPHEITVLRTPSYPIAVLQVTPQEASVGTSITFDASLSTDPDGWIGEYGFDFGDGSLIFWTTNPIVYHTYTKQGTYYSTVTVSDNSGLETVSGPVKVTTPKYYTDWKSYDHNYWYTEPKGQSDPPCDSDTNLVFTLPAHNATFQQKVATKNTLSYGRFIVRFKMSKYVTGLLGSFFLYYAPHGDGAPDHQEIDVEWWGKESSDWVHFVFWQNGGKGNGIPTEDKLVLLPFLLDDGEYHICEIDYEPNKVTFIIDGTTYYEKTIAITPPLYFFTGQVWAREWAPPADYKLYVDSTEIWQDSTAPTNTLSVSVKSSVNLFLTDPLNRSIGTDPNTDQFVNEIPDAFYTGPYAEPQNILIPEPLAGNYVLVGSGIGNGHYTLTIESVVNNSFVDAHSWQGAINSGQVMGENITLDPGGGVVLTHDIRIEDLIPSKTIVGQGYCIDSNFTVEDCGNCTETFNVTVCVNQTVIAQFINVTLTSRDWTSLLCEWNTSGFGMGDYAVAVVADPVPGELDIGNNNCTSGVLIVSIPGDINGDGTVNILDAIQVSNSFLATPSSSNWNPNADINGDGVVNILDAIILSNNFLRHFP